MQEGEQLQGDEEQEAEAEAEAEAEEGEWEDGEEWGEADRGELLGAVCAALASLGEGNSVLAILAMPISDALVSTPSPHCALGMPILCRCKVHKMQQ